MLRMGRVGVGFEEVRAYDIVPLGNDRLLAMPV
jgi:hypothetical protein